MSVLQSQSEVSSNTDLQLGMGFFNFISGKHTDLSKQSFMRMDYRTVCLSPLRSHRNDINMFPNTSLKVERAMSGSYAIPSLGWRLIFDEQCRRLQIQI
jgi:hypothetical protein